MTLKNSAFTLVEYLIVFAIVGLLVAVGISNLFTYKISNEELAKCHSRFAEKSIENCKEYILNEKLWCKQTEKCSS